MTSEQRFRLEVELTDRSVYTFDDNTAWNAQECVRVFATRDGDGLRFVQTSTCGLFFWPWNEIRSVAVRPWPEMPPGSEQGDLS